MRATWEAVQAAAAPVMADLERAAPGRVRLVPHDDLDGPEAVLVDAGMSSGVWLGDGFDEPWQAVLHMTEQVQEAAFEHLWTTWPDCPQHPTSHPLDPDGDSDRAVWRCPASGQVIAEVGSLGASR